MSALWILGEAAPGALAFQRLPDRKTHISPGLKRITNASHQCTVC